MSADKTVSDVPLAEMLGARASLLKQVRKFFDDAGFIEVQPPCLSRDNVVDAHIDPVEVAGEAVLLPADIVAPRYYLQSSPEFAMKRMLAGGSGPIYSLGPVFRAGERSPRHNVEFTMLEWYDVDVGMDAVIDQTIQLVSESLTITDIEIITYRELFRKFAGFDPIEEPITTLQAAVARIDVSLAESLAGQRDALLDVLMTELIEPQVSDQNLLIHNYPLTQAALARRSDEDPQTAERFELMIGGLEIANGYGELLDADELVRRNIENNRKRTATGRAPLPVESVLVEAMRRGIPRCAGVALGFDRLLMLQQSTADIADVIALPIEIA
jgi:elongation factor P--(R)-beta-lysine ligase